MDAMTCSTLMRGLHTVGAHAVDLGRLYRQSIPLPERPGHEAADRMLLPSSSLHHLLAGRAASSDERPIAGSTSRTFAIDRASSPEGSSTAELWFFILNATRVRADRPCSNAHPPAVANPLE